MNLKIDCGAAGRRSRDLVYQTIKESILELYLEPGAAVNEGDIAAALGVSRTPIREAFVRLNRENLVVSYPQRGSFVTRIDMRLVEEAIFMRRCLETAVYPRVARSAPPEVVSNLRKLVGFQKALAQSGEDYYSEFMALDNQFHQSIFEADGKGNIWNSIMDLSTHFNRLRFLELKEQTNIDKVLHQHETLAQAIAAHEEGDIDRIVCEHSGNIMRIVEKIKEKYPDYFLSR